MKSNDQSSTKEKLYPAKLVHAFTRFISTRKYGNVTFFLDEEAPPSCGPTESFDPENSPPWIIHREDLIAINRIYAQLIKEITEIKPPEKDYEKSEGFLVFVGGCIISKVILLIHYLLLSYNYYKIKTVSFPGMTISSCLNPEIVPDLKEAILLSFYAIFDDTGQHPYLRASILSQLYAMMKILFDVMNGMLPCEEVARLREAYDTFHLTKGEGDSFTVFIDRLQAVSRRFAAEEPKWEQERAKSPYTEPIPVIKNAAGLAPLASAGRRPRKRIPVKLAATIFETHPNTILNWDKGRGRPEEYPERDVSEAIFRAAAARYFMRLQNEEQAAKNRDNGLTHRSAEPKSSYGRDSTVQAQTPSSGNYIRDGNNEVRRPLH